MYFNARLWFLMVIHVFLLCTTSSLANTLYSTLIPLLANYVPATTVIAIGGYLTLTCTLLLIALWYLALQMGIYTTYCLTSLESATPQHASTLHRLQDTLNALARRSPDCMLHRLTLALLHTLLLGLAMLSITASYMLL